MSEDQTSYTQYLRGKFLPKTRCSLLQNWRNKYRLWIWFLFWES